MTPESLLLRQVNLSWIREGRITSQVFRPTLKDAKKLSVYAGAKITPEGSYRLYTGTLRLASVGVMAVSVAECRKETLPVIPHPRPFPEHVVIDFGSCSNAEIKTKAKRLTESARLRGWQYRALTS